MSSSVIIPDIVMPPMSWEPWSLAHLHRVRPRPAASPDIMLDLRVLGSLDLLGELP